MREPVALVAHGRHAEPAGDRARRVLDVVARLVRADADALLARRGHRPGVAAADQRAVDPDVEVRVAAARVGVDLEPARDQRLGRLHVRSRPEDAAPAERVDDQRSGDRAAVRLHDDRGFALRDAVGSRRAGSGGAAGTRLRRRLARRYMRHLEARVALIPQLVAERPVVERGPAPRQPEARRAVRRVERHAGQLLADRVAHPHRVQPRRRCGAGRRLALAELVAVDDQHVGPRAGELARDGQPREARAADEHVGPGRRVLERRALGAAQRRAASHRRNAPSAAPGTCQARTPARRPSTSKSIRSTRSSTRS